MIVGMSIDISLRSQELIKDYWAAHEQEFLDSSQSVASIDFATLLSWLDDKSTNAADQTKKTQQELEFILLSLHAELLHTLFMAMRDNDIQRKKPKEDATYNDKIKFILLLLAGILVKTCEGFDIVATMMGIFFMPTLIILLSGLAFSSLSILMFCGFDLVRVSNNLGVKLSDANKLLDIYVQQLHEIKYIRKKIAAYTLSDLSVSELHELKQILDMLQKRFVKVSAAGEQFDLILNSMPMQIAKFVFACTGSLLFFGGSFCAAQTTSLFMLSLFMVAVTPASLSVLLFSTAVGLAAFSLYWCIEFPGIKRLLGGWFGLDEDKVDILCDKDLLGKEERKLAKLQNNVQCTLRLKGRLAQLEHHSYGLEELAEDDLVAYESGKKPVQPRTLVGSNPHSFMPPRSRSASVAEDRPALDNAPPVLGSS